MAISEVLKNNANPNANASGAAPAQAAPAAPAAGGAAPKAKGKKQDTGKLEQFKAQGATARQTLSDDEKAMEGSKSDKVEFICALGNPSVKQARSEAKQSIPCYKVVGYKLRMLEDGTVPVAPIKKDWKTQIDVEYISSRPVKAGEIVNLNIIETADLISRPEYAGKFTGGAIAVNLTAKTSQDRQDPMPVLNKVGDGSIKENMELIADMVGGDGTIKGGATAKVKPEYEETFGVLFRSRSIGGKGTGVGRASGETQKDLAAAFRNLYNSMRQ